VSLAGLALALRAGQLTPAEAVSTCLTRIGQRDAELNAFISVRSDEALTEAANLLSIPPSERGSLWGVPLAVKDCIDVAGVVTTAASRTLLANMAAADAEVVRRLREAGAVIVGKLNMHEFSYGPFTTSTSFGPAHNPWDLARVCGGSSGGSAAAVAARLVPGALGTDSTGSVRLPAAFCGVTGLRPTTGAVPVHGTVPLSATVDTVGPMAADAVDCALLFAVVSGTAQAAAPEGMGTLPRLGIVTELFDDCDPAVASVVAAAVTAIGAMALRVEPVHIARLDAAVAAQQLLQFPEASAQHLDWVRARGADMDADVRGRLLAGLFIPAAAYETARRARPRITAELNRAFARCEVLVAPSVPVVAPFIHDVLDDPGESGSADLGSALRRRFARYTSPWSLAGFPVVTIPCGTVGGLPVGVSLIGRGGSDMDVLRVAAAVQARTTWHLQRPESSLYNETETMSDNW
jgi:aspartyl-tRNA(Asn)/glutamyl-tRNA(Gln) amidotransferase subunit A